VRIVQVLHLYQPPYQTSAILAKVVNECYMPLASLLQSPQNKPVLLNINASLTELLLANGHTKVLDLLRGAAGHGNLEFMGSAAYHPILPLLPRDMIQSQITINNEVNQAAFGDVYQPSVFFFPEMCFTPWLAEVVATNGFRYIVLDELSYDGQFGTYPKDCLFHTDGVTTVLRHRTLSNALARSIWRTDDIDSAARFKELVAPEIGSGGFVCLATDGEVFGHHHEGRHQFLAELLSDGEIQFCSPSELKGLAGPSRTLAPRPCSWSSQEFELQAGIPYALWRDPSNEIHELQWRMVDLALEVLKARSAVDISPTRPVMKAVASDQFFWASCRPWWNASMVEQGARELCGAICEAAGAQNAIVDRALSMRDVVLSKVAEWEAKGEAQRRKGAFLSRAGLDEKTLGSSLL
jgi:hypothetical protein